MFPRISVEEKELTAEMDFALPNYEAMFVEKDFFCCWAFVAPGSIFSHCQQNKGLQALDMVNVNNNSSLSLPLSLQGLRQRELLKPSSALMDSGFLEMLVINRPIFSHPWLCRTVNLLTWCIPSNSNNTVNYLLFWGSGVPLPYHLSSKHVQKKI